MVLSHKTGGKKYKAIFFTSILSHAISHATSPDYYLINFSKPKIYFFFLNQVSLIFVPFLHWLLQLHSAQNCCLLPRQPDQSSHPGSSLRTRLWWWWRPSWGRWKKMWGRGSSRPPWRRRRQPGGSRWHPGLTGRRGQQRSESRVGCLVRCRRGCLEIDYRIENKLSVLNIRDVQCTVRAPVFGRHQFFGTSEHYGKSPWKFIIWMNELHCMLLVSYI